MNTTMMLMDKMLRKNGYYFEMETETLYMTKAFEKKACSYGSEECNVVLGLREMFADLKMEVRKPSTSKSKKQDDEKKKMPAISYEQMKEYIFYVSDTNTIRDNLATMEAQKQMSLVQPSPYKYVMDWFRKTYPAYYTMITFDENGKPQFGSQQ